MKKQNGITLIALVITIIVLLILAGVSIAMLTGDNGILTKAGTAKTKTIEAEAAEAVKIAVGTILANQYDPTDTTSTRKTITADNIIAQVQADTNATVVSLTSTPEGVTKPADATIELTYTASTGLKAYVAVSAQGKVLLSQEIE